MGFGTLRVFSQSTVSVEDFGAVGDGLTYAHVAIQKAITAAGSGGTVVFPSGNVYNLGKRLVAQSGQTWLGAGATLRRCDSIRSRLAAPASAGSKSIEVEDASLFEVGMDVTPIRGAAMQDGEGGFDWQHLIVGISGNVITMEHGLGQDYAAGDFVISIHPLVEVPYGSEEVSLNELHFDGNRDGNEGHHAWQLAQILVLRGTNHVVEACLFENSWGDAINLGGVNSQILSNRFDKAGGSAIHLSSTENISIRGNYFANLCQSADLALHTEGAVTVSQENRLIGVSRNTFTNINGLIVGYIDPTGNRDITVEDNEAFACKGLVDVIFDQDQFRPGYEPPFNLIFRRNRAADVGRIWIRNIIKTKIKGITIADNVIANGYLILEGSSGANVINNQFVMVFPEVYGNNFLPSETSGGLVTIRSSDNVTLHGNTLVGGRKGLAIQNWNTITVSNIFVTGNTVLNSEIHALELGTRPLLNVDSDMSDYSGVTIDGNSFIGANSGADDDLGWLGRKATFSNNYLESRAGGLQVAGGAAALTAHTQIYRNTFFVVKDPLLIPFPNALDNMIVVSNVFSGALHSAFSDGTGNIIEANEGLLRELQPQLIQAGEQLSLTLTPGHTIAPPGALHFSLLSAAPDGLSLDPSRGILYWQPGAEQEDTTNLISVAVSHPDSPELTFSRTFTIVVAPTIRLVPQIQPDGRLQITLSGNASSGYQVQVSSNLIDWSTLSNTDIQMSPGSFVDPNAAATPARFYRILLSR